MKIICVDMVKLLSVGEGGVCALLSKSIVSVSLLKSIFLQELFIDFIKFVQFYF